MKHRFQLVNGKEESSSKVLGNCAQYFVWGELLFFTNKLALMHMKDESQVFKIIKSTN